MPIPLPFRRRPGEIRGFFLALALFVAFVLGLICLIGIFRDRTPELTEGTLKQAEERWAQAKVTDYDARITLGGATPGEVGLKVRGGKVVEMVRDGRTPPERTWNVWTVPGQFEMLWQELENAENTPADASGQKSRWILKAEFHPRLGYPVRFRRMILGPGPEVAWDMEIAFPAGSEHR